MLNSAALARWEIDESTADVPGGRIGRYPDGRLNGELIDRAKGLVTLPTPPPADPQAAVEALVEEHATLNDLVKDVASADVFVCGPVAWAKQVEAEALWAGVPAEAIHREEFAW